MYIRINTIVAKMVKWKAYFLYIFHHWTPMTRSFLNSGPFLAGWVPIYLWVSVFKATGSCKPTNVTSVVGVPIKVVGTRYKINWQFWMVVDNSFQHKSNERVLSTIKFVECPAYHRSSPLAKMCVGAQILQWGKFSNKGYISIVTYTLVGGVDTGVTTGVLSRIF